MTHHAAFLADIVEHPDDDEPRLIYADWLEDNGQPERAEFIHVQCDIAQFPGEWSAEQMVNLRRRERDLLFDHWPRWTHETFDALAHDVGVAESGDDMLVHFYDDRKNETAEFRCYWRRGFVTRVTLPLGAWRGERCPDCNGRGQLFDETDTSNPQTLSQCPTCRTPALGPLLVRQAPLERVTLSDKQPDHEGAGGYYGWYVRGRIGGFSGDRAELPLALWNLLRGGRVVAAGQAEAGNWKDYPTRQAAIDALSCALLLWAGYAVELADVRVEKLRLAFRRDSLGRRIGYTNHDRISALSVRERELVALVG